ncbi:hypothetical protein D3C81_920540 [compost metagenome]
MSMAMPELGQHMAAADGRCGAFFSMAWRQGMARRYFPRFVRKFFRVDALRNVQLAV